MIKKLLHFMVGCQPGKLLWDGFIEVIGKKNYEGYQVLGFRVFECSVCGQPVVVMKKEVDRQT